MDNTYRLFIDDERFPAKKDEGNVVIVRSYDEAVKYMEKHGCPEWISFDHDLGENSKSGLDIVKWMIEYDRLRGLSWIPYNYPGEDEEFAFVVHSQNPIGAANIASLLTNYLEFRDDLP